MSKAKTFIKLIRYNKAEIGKAVASNIARSPISRVLPDKAFLKLQYRLILGKKLNLKNPQTFNEKLQWLKLYDRNPDYIPLVDKYEVKKYIKEMIGEEYVVPTLGIWDSVEEIDFNSLPEQFVLKCTHDSGSTIICKNKTTFDVGAAKAKLNKRLHSNLFWWGREWPYKNVKPRILAEKYLTNGDRRDDLSDYKVHNFNGVPKMVLVCKNRFGEHGMSDDFFTVDWEHIPVQRPASPNSKVSIEKPKQLAVMIELSKRLSANIPFVRTDFYTVQNKVYFGELTFYPGTGMLPFEPDYYDKMFGDWLVLPAL